jgi:glutamyl-tRNA reductase
VSVPRAPRTAPAVDRRSARRSPDGVALADIRVRFATYREADAETRSALAGSLADASAKERVLIDTCHRVELVAVGGDGQADVTGRAAVRRLLTVVAGFDSAVVAEEQLIGQVRGAYEAALARRETGPILNELFRRALRFGRRVRAHARPGTDRSLADPGLAWLLGRLGAPGTVIVAGTGEMGRLVARRLADAGHRVTVGSRSVERGGALLEELRGDDHHLVVGPIPANRIADAQAVVLAVRTRAPVLEMANLGHARPWVLDLSTPPAVAADAVAALGERHLGLDDLGRRADGQRVLEPSVERRLREELEREVDAFARWLEERRGGDAIAVLHREADAVRRRHLARLRAGVALDEAQLEAVEAVSAAMIGELLHGPSVELRRGGADADVVRRLFGVDR